MEEGTRHKAVRGTEKYVEHEIWKKIKKINYLTIKAYFKNQFIENKKWNWNLSDPNLQFFILTFSFLLRLGLEIIEQFKWKHGNENYINY